jgi:hypothetical protein
MTIQNAVARHNDVNHAMQPMHAYEVRPREDHRGINLISDALPVGRLCVTGSRLDHFDCRMTDDPDMM